MAYTWKLSVSVEMDDRGRLSGYWIDQREPGDRWAHRADGDPAGAEGPYWAVELLRSVVGWLASLQALSSVLQGDTVDFEDLASAPRVEGPASARVDKLLRRVWFGVDD